MVGTGKLRPVAQMSRSSAQLLYPRNSSLPRIIATNHTTTPHDNAIIAVTADRIAGSPAIADLADPLQRGSVFHPEKPANKAQHQAPLPSCVHSVLLSCAARRQSGVVRAAAAVRIRLRTWMLMYPRAGQ